MDTLCLRTIKNSDNSVNIRCDVKKICKRFEPELRSQGSLLHFLLESWVGMKILRYLVKGAT